MSGAWTILATGTGDSATAASVAIPKPAGGGRIKIAAVSASFSVAAIKSFTIVDGSTTKGTYHVHNQRDVLFDPPLDVADSATVSLAAVGAAGASAINVHYFKL